MAVANHRFDLEHNKTVQPSALLLKDSLNNKIAEEDNKCLCNMMMKMKTKPSTKL